MKANELRIGNYTQSVNGYLEDVKSISINQITTGKNYNYSEFSAYHPKIRTEADLATGKYGAPITEKWLQNFNLEKDGGRYMINKYFTYIHSTGSGYYLEDGPGNAISIRLEYVHQLQNLYFALTGEELTIKPTEV